MIKLAENQNRHLGRIIYLPEENRKPLFVISFTQPNREELEKFKKLLREYLENPKPRIMYAVDEKGNKRRVTPYWFTRLFRKYMRELKWGYYATKEEIIQRYMSGGLKGVFNL